MNSKPAEDLARPAPPNGVELVLLPRVHDLGGFEVRRALPAQKRQMVGPFIFLDQMGPGEFLAGRALDVRPHPHIGLSTVTYLFDGSILQRDNWPGWPSWLSRPAAGRAVPEHHQPQLTG